MSVHTCMRIAIVSAGICGGGSERVTVNLANSFCREDHIEVFLFTGFKRAKEYPLNQKVKRICIFKQSLLTDVFSLRKMLKKNKIDIAIGMGIYANFCICLANFFVRTKMIVSERNSPGDDMISKKSKLLRFLIYRRADAYVFQTRQAQKYYSKTIRRKSVIIHNPLKELLPFRLKCCKKEIVAVGRLMPQKNYSLLIDVFSKVHLKYPEYILRIFGEGDERDHLEKQVFDLNLNSFVIFEGFCEDVHERIKASEIYVISSLFEGMPNALMEAMAMGFPVISTDCPAGGSAELIRNGENGILVKNNDIVQMEQAVINLIEHADLRDRLGSNAMKIRESHNSKKISDQWLDLFLVLMLGSRREQKLYFNERNMKYLI